ncbi:MAG: hypothetical protein QOK17_2678 [Sphingomonadales bacterium]|jgi:hypothetical protein|nr:hypothetical protein [Sphingomonadales bacterium]
MVLVRKYELLATRHFTPEGKPLWQLRALIDFARVKAGDLGGLIEGEHNLPQEGLAWVYPGAVLHGDGYVSDGTPIIPVAVRPVMPDPSVDDAFPRPPGRRRLRPRSRQVIW